MPRRTLPRSVLVLSAIVTLGLFFFRPLAQGQPVTDAPRPGGRNSSLDPLRPSVPVPMGPRHPALRAPDDDVQLGRALAGSVLGAAVGGLLGAALLTAAEPKSGRPFEDDEENEAEGLGLLLIAGGAPTGAVLNTRPPRDHAGAYVMAVLGELVLGGAGAALGASLAGRSERARLIGGLAGGGAGVIVGAAGGAVLAAPDDPGGALTYEDGAWRPQLPSVQIGVHRRPQLSLHGTVSLVSVEL